MSRSLPWPDDRLADDPDALADLGAAPAGQGLVEEVLVDAVALLAPVLLGPGDPEPALVPHLGHEGPARRGVDDLGHVLPGDVEDLGVVVLVEEALDLGHEGELLRRELEVHALPSGLPGSPGPADRPDWSSDRIGYHRRRAGCAGVRLRPGPRPVSFLDERAGLAGKVALVAGGGGGLGRASALDLARAGVALALADVDADALRATADEARAHGVEVRRRPCIDVRDADALAGLFDACDRVASAASTSSSTWWEGRSARPSPT